MGESPVKLFSNIVKGDKPDRRELLLKARRGDSGAFEQLLAYYRAPVYSYILRCGVDSASRDDVFQDIFIKIHKAASTYRSRYPLDPWIFTIVANTVRSFYRTRRVRAMIHGEGGKIEQVSEIDSHELAEAQETAEWLEQEILKLTFSEREVVVLCCIQHLSQKDAAVALSMPLNTVKNHLRRARIKLASALKRRNTQHSREVLS